MNDPHLVGSGLLQPSEHGDRVVGLKSDGHAAGEFEVSAEIAERLRFDALLSDLAAGFINLEPEQVDQAIEDCLHHIVEALGVAGARWRSSRVMTWSRQRS